jgi:hypothetical protein
MRLLFNCARQTLTRRREPNRAPAQCIWEPCWLPLTHTDLGPFKFNGSWMCCNRSFAAEIKIAMGAPD